MCGLITPVVRSLSTAAIVQPEQVLVAPRPQAIEPEPPLTSTPLIPSFGFTLSPGLQSILNNYLTVFTYKPQDMAERGVAIELCDNALDWD